MNRLICAALVASFASPVIAQETMPDDGDAVVFPEEASALDRPAWDTGVKVSLFGGYEYQASSGLNLGGRVAIHRGVGVANIRVPLRRDLAVTYQLATEIEKWNFSGVTSLGGTNPWDDVYAWVAAVSFEWSASDSWTILGGPILRSSYVGGADIGDTITGGGYAAVAYQASDDLVIGGGLGVVTQIEDSTLIFPVIILEWELANDLVLESRTYSASRTGAELRWDASRDLSLSVGAAYMNDRFRLNKSAFMSEGVVEEESLTWFVRAAWAFTPQSQLAFQAGLVTEGELTIDDLNGNLQQSEDFDEALMFGLTFRHQF